MSDEQWTQEFTTRLRRKMNSEGVNQRQLSQRTGLSEASISKYISGERTPKGPTLTKLAKALNASLYELIPIER